MRHGRIIYVLGDVHGAFNILNDFIHHKIRKNRTLKAIAPRWKADGDDLRVIIMQCGDFAYFWPNFKNRGAILNRVDFLQDGRIPIYWIGGNHEDWDELDMLGGKITEVDRGVFYCPFGTTLELSPEITVLFAGGAESADKEWRLKRMAKGVCKIWWEQEGISEADMERLELVPKADWVISHTAPLIFDLDDEMRAILNGGSLKFEPSRLKLNRVFDRYQPERWFFGHFHHHMTGFTEGCEWECLSNMDGLETSWTKIYLEWND